MGNWGAVATPQFPTSVSVLAIAFAATVALPTVAAAQDAARIGVHAGLNVATTSSFDQDGEDDLRGILDFLAGLHVAKNLNKNIGVRAEVNFSRKGTTVELGVDDAKIKLSYVDVPVLVTLGPSDGHLDFFTGPQFSFKRNAEAQFRDQTVSSNDLIKESDLAWVVGFLIGGKDRVQLDFRYAHGLENISRETGTIKNRVLSAVLGVNLTK